MRAITQESSAPFEGLDDKIKLIEDYYEESLRYPTIRALAERLSADETGAPNIASLFAALRSRVRYVPDPVGAELIKAPWVQADEINSRGYTMGDCDDFASLGFTILRSVGVPAQLAVGWYGGNALPSHIWDVVPNKDGSLLCFDLCARALGLTKAGPDKVKLYG